MTQAKCGGQVKTGRKTVYKETPERQTTSPAFLMEVYQK
jgi:hypothetical protein